MIHKINKSITFTLAGDEVDQLYTLIQRAIWYEQDDPNELIRIDLTEPLLAALVEAKS